MFNGGGKSERKELGGSKMAGLFAPDSRNLEMSEIRARDPSGGRTQWDFPPLADLNISP